MPVSAAFLSLGGVGASALFHQAVELIGGYAGILQTF